MAKEHFKKWAPREHSIERLAYVRGINAEYKEQGFTLSLRQIFYQFVARGLLDNSLAGYQAIKELLIRARESGEIDWNDIEDRGRAVVTHPSWENPAAIIDAVASQYAEDLWDGQSCRVEVLIEKSALVGVIDGVCREFQVPYLSMRGNNSITMLYEAAKRYQDLIDSGIKPMVLMLADHDPTGYFIPSVVQQKLSQYARQPIEVRRIGLNLDQINRYNPPPNRLKEKDPRHAAYVRETGLQDGWELDALEPSVLSQLIRDEVTSLLDVEAWEAAKDRWQDNKSILEQAANRWIEIAEMLASDAGRQ
jgi:hypothetical protein